MCEPTPTPSFIAFYEFGATLTTYLHAFLGSRRLMTGAVLAFVSLETAGLLVSTESAQT
jgi:hypothetical protein